MRKKLFLLPVLFVLTACSFNVSLFPPVKPYQEEILEGTGKPKIVVVDLTGVISLSETGGRLRAEPSKVGQFVEALKKAEKDKDVKGLIIKVNSPGGTVTASDFLYHEILRFKEAKKVPVYAYIMEIGASGAYYASSAADKIIINPTAVTGSIGVIAMKFNIQGLMSKIGVADEVYKSAPMKDFWSPFRPSTPEEKRMMQGIIDSLYGRFIEAVYSQRQKEITLAQVKAAADGRVYTADQALKLKLVDMVGYPDQAIGKMKEEIGVKEARIVTYTRPGSYKPNLYSEMSAIAGVQPLSLLGLSVPEDLREVRFMYVWNP